MTVDELTAYGVVRMTDDEIRGYLTSHSVGVLGLPTDGAPSMRPMSFAYDDERLYLLYVLGETSQKAELTEQAEVARFLVYSAEATFNWRSVLLTGTLEPVPEDEQETALAVLKSAWRPDALEQAIAAEDTRLYQFVIREQVGVRHMGLPPEFEK